ncbi:MAG: ArsC/Spx/MgsR family protein [Propionibacteriaceae bacterium]|nr:ArsC/Spx/MgsR family protein [Propionibacteriaceae bacterium]
MTEEPTTDEVTIYHNPRCSTSRKAVDAVAGATVVPYLKEPLDAPALRHLLDILQDPATDLVRRDARFAALGLGEDDVASADQVVDVLVAHPELMQRPVLVRGERAIIGRPPERVASFMA